MLDMRWRVESVRAGWNETFQQLNKDSVWRLNFIRKLDHRYEVHRHPVS